MTVTKRDAKRTYLVPFMDEKDERGKDEPRDEGKGLKHDADKLRYGLVQERAHRELVAVLTYGATKYQAGNWRHVSDAKARYYEAAQRHLSLHRLASPFDGESSLFHLAHAMCCIHFMLELEIEAEDHEGSFEMRFEHAMKKAHVLREARLAKERCDELAAMTSSEGASK